MELKNKFMKKIIFLSILLLIIPFAASAICLPPVNYGYTNESQCKAIKAQNAATGAEMSGQASSSGLLQNCENEVAQYQADTLTYQNCLSSSVSTPPTVIQTPPSSSASAGTLQLMDFPSQFVASVGSNFSAYINFIYSGSRQLRVTITGLKLPEGVSLGSIAYDYGGVDSITLSGIPTSIGEYNLNLVITDNNGALINQPFKFKVNGLVFTDASLPDAIVSKEYVQNLNFTYTGGTPTINYVYPTDGLNVESVNVSGNGYDGQNKTAILRLLPYKIGQFSIKAVARMNGIEIGSKTFVLNVVSSITPPTAQASVEQNIPTVVTPQPVKQTPNPPPAKKVVVEKSVQPVTTVQNVQPATAGAKIQPQVQAEPKPQTKTNASKNIFSNIWNFVKNIFKFGK